MQQRERRPGPRLAIRDPRAVGVVVQPKLHCAPQLSTDTLGRVVGAAGLDRPAGPPSRGRADPVRALRVPRRHPARRHAAHGVRALAARPRAGAGGARRAVSPRRTSRAAPCPRDVDAPPGPDRRRRAASGARGRRGALRRPAGRGRRRRDARARPRTPPSASRSTTRSLPPVVDPRAGRALARWEKRAGDVAGAFAARRPRRPHRARDPAPGRDADGDRAARSPTPTGGRADGLVVVAERAPAAGAARADPRPRRRSCIRVIVPDVGGGFGSKGTLPVETPLVALAGARAGAAGQVGRGPARELARGAAGPRAARVGRAGARRRRPHPRAARAHPGRPRRLPAAEHARSRRTRRRCC